MLYRLSNPAIINKFNDVIPAELWLHHKNSHNSGFFSYLQLFELFDYLTPVRDIAENYSAVEFDIAHEKNRSEAHSVAENDIA